MIKKLIKPITLLSAVFLSAQSVLAQGLDFGAGEDVGLGTITLPTFLNLDQIQNFSPWSYLALIISLFFVVVTIYWVFLVIRAAVGYIQSAGDSGKIETSVKQLGNVFWSVTFLFGFFIVLSLAAMAFGLGGFWNWPKALSVCDNGQLYFVRSLESPDLGKSIDESCFGGGTSNTLYEQCKKNCEFTYTNSIQIQQCINTCLNVD